MDFTSFFFLFLASFLFIFLFHFPLNFFSSNGRKLPLPPGSLAWPYIGETFQLYSQNLNAFFASNQKRYGAIFKSWALPYSYCKRWFGQNHIATISSPQAAKFVLVTRALFKPTFPASKKRMLGKLRKLVLRAFMPEAIKHVVWDFESIAKDTLQSLEGSLINTFEEMKTIHFLGMMFRQLFFAFLVITQFQLVGGDMSIAARTIPCFIPPPSVANANPPPPTPDTHVGMNPPPLAANANPQPPPPDAPVYAGMNPPPEAKSPLSWLSAKIIKIILGFAISSGAAIIAYFLKPCNDCTTPQLSESSVFPTESHSTASSQSSVPLGMTPSSSHRVAVTVSMQVDLGVNCSQSSTSRGCEHTVV